MFSQDMHHAPRFNDVVGPHMSDRALLGLPEAYRDLRMAYDRTALRSLAMASQDIRLALLSDSSAPLGVRLSAGLLLALDGDPRLDPRAPDMCRVPGGTIEVGLPPDQVDAVMARCDGLGLDRDWVEKETPRHQVVLGNFQIGRFPVTNHEYRTFLAETGAEMIPEGWRFGRFPEHEANHPVHTVTAAQADAYCDWLARVTGRAFRLPTEAEWEYAAAGLQGRDFPWGGTWAADHANTAEEGLFRSSPVGAFPKGVSWCGAHDMAGNVEEYMADDYRTYPGGPEILDDLSTQGT